MPFCPGNHAPTRASDYLSALPSRRPPDLAQPKERTMSRPQARRAVRYSLLYPVLLAILAVARARDNPC